MTATSDRMAWWGTCERCATIVVVAAHDETDAEHRGYIAAGPDEWDGTSECPVCDGYMDWNGSDPVEDVLRHH